MKKKGAELKGVIGGTKRVYKNTSGKKKNQDVVDIEERPSKRTRLQISKNVKVEDN